MLITMLPIPDNPPLTAQECRAKYRTYCKVSKVLEKDDVYEAEVLTEALKDQLRGRARALLQENRQRPVMLSYCSDATPILCQVVRTVASEGGTFMRRQGNRLHELLLQRGCLVANVRPGVYETAHLCEDPRPLSKGKGGWEHFTAATQFFGMLRHEGHEGFCITHLAFDRAVYQPVLRHMSGRHAAYYDPQHGPDLGHRSHVLWLTDWLIGTPCACHDTHNALKWAVDEWIDAPGLKDLHIAVESLRNGYDLLVLRVRTFLSRHLFARKQPMDFEEATTFWRVMGVDATWLDRVARLDLSWNPETRRLRVNRCGLGDQELLVETEIVMLYVMKFSRFSDSRWGSMAACSRTLLASVECGLDELFRITRDDPTAVGRSAHLTGYARFTAAIRVFAGVTAMCGYITDVVLFDLMQDDRLGLRVDDVEDEMAREMIFLENVPDAVWDRLAHLSRPDAHPSVLKSDCIRAGHIACSYMYERFVREARGYPWRLARGAVEQNIEELVELPKSAVRDLDPLTMKVRTLGRKRIVNASLLADTVRMLLQIQWSTLAVEQAHGSAAAIRRVHPGYSANVLSLRSMLHTMRHVFFPSPLRVRLAKVDTALSKVGSKKPHKIPAKGMYFKVFSKRVREVRKRQGKTTSGALMRNIMRSSEQSFSALAPEAREYYEGLALHRIREKTTAQREELQHLRLRKKNIVEDEKEDARSRALMKLSDVRFSDNTMDQLANRVQVLARNRQNIAVLREEAWVAPGKPDVGVMETFDKLATHGLLAGKTVADPVLKLLADKRSELRGHLLCAPFVGAPKTAYFILFANAGKRDVQFLPLQERDDMPPVMGEESLDEDMTLALEHTLFRYTYHTGDYIPYKDLPTKVPEELFFIEGGAFVGSRNTRADFEPEMLKDFAARHRFQAKEPVEKPAAKPRAKGAASLSKKQKKWLEQRPWAKEFVEDLLPLEDVPSSSTMAPAPPTELAQAVLEEDELSDIDDETKQAVWEELEGTRLAWCLTDTETSENFFTTVRGGVWTIKNKGVAVDVGAAYARRGLPRYWAAKYSMGRMASFSFALYGEDTARILSDEWCFRCQWFFVIWRGQEDLNYLYQPEDGKGYIPSEAFIDVYLSLPSLGPITDRCSEIFNLFPSEPVEPSKGRKKKGKRPKGKKMRGVSSKVA